MLLYSLQKYFNVQLILAIITPLPCKIAHIQASLVKKITESLICCSYSVSHLHSKDLFQPLEGMRQESPPPQAHKL